MKNVNNNKIAKGYRLKPETHNMIRKIQKTLRGDLDEAINLACRKFLKELKETNRGKIIMRTLLLFLLLASNLFAQPSQQWVVNYNGTGNSNDRAFSIVLDTAGNSYVTGESVPVGGVGADYTTIKYNPQGVQQWISRYHKTPGSVNRPLMILIDGAGNTYVTGQSQGTGGFDVWDIVTIKYNPNGDSLWVKRFNGTGSRDDRPLDMALDLAGNVYITGTSFGASSYDYVTIKYNTSGNQLWASYYSSVGDSTDEASGIALDGLGNVYVTGTIKRNGNYSDFATVKYNSAGVYQWDMTYNSTIFEFAYDIIVDASSNVYVTGMSGFDYLTIKYNSSGGFLWLASYDGTANGQDAPAKIALDSLNNVYVTGYSNGTGTGQDYLTVKYNNSGVQQWTARYNGPANNSDIVYDMKVSNNGNVFITGSSLGSGSGYDFATLGYNTAGAQLWVVRYNGAVSGTDVASSLFLRGQSLFITGRTAVTGNTDDFTTIRYSSIFTSVTPVSNSILDDFSLSQNYPNPFNPATRIEFDIPMSPFEGGRGMVALKVYDILGREVQTLVNEQLSPGSYEIDFDGTNLAAGIYFYTLSADYFSETKKMILVK